MKELLMANSWSLYEYLERNCNESEYWKDIAEDIAGSFKYKDDYIEAMQEIFNEDLEQILGLLRFVKCKIRTGEDDLVEYGLGEYLLNLNTDVEVDTWELHYNGDNRYTLYCGCWGYDDVFEIIVPNDKENDLVLNTCYQLEDVPVEDYNF